MLDIPKKWNLNEIITRLLLTKYALLHHVKTSTVLIYDKYGSADGEI